ncbi:MAG: DUF4190 domain-containing protein [Ktedonobacterales bacterium]|nr:DUF4190 domain-containing protein [Ktedonobacterales bacterium]
MYPPQGDQPAPQQPYGAPPPDYGQQPTGTPPNYGAPPEYGAQPNYNAPPGYGPPPGYGQAPAYGQPYAYPGMVPGAPQSNGLATASLVLGLLMFLFGIFTGIPAVITGHMALGRIKQNPALAGSRGQAIAGLVLGYISIGLTVIGIVAIIAIVATASVTTVTTTP